MHKNVHKDSFAINFNEGIFLKIHHTLTNFERILWTGQILLATQNLFSLNEWVGELKKK